MKHTTHSLFCLLIALLLSACTSTGEKAAATKANRTPVPSSFLWQKATRGDAAAQVDAGDLYAKGRGVPRDRSKAESWYAKAALQGNKTALKRLGTAALLTCGKHKIVIAFNQDAEAAQIYETGHAPQILKNSFVGTGVEYISFDNSYIFSEYNGGTALSINSEYNYCDEQSHPEN